MHAGETMHCQPCYKKNHPTCSNKICTQFCCIRNFVKMKTCVDLTFTIKFDYSHVSLYRQTCPYHYNDVIMGTMASQITSFTNVYSTVYSGAHQRKHQSSASLTFVRGIHRWPVNSPHKGPVTWKLFPFDDVIIWTVLILLIRISCIISLALMLFSAYLMPNHCLTVPAPCPIPLLCL